MPEYLIYIIIGLVILLAILLIVTSTRKKAILSRLDKFSERMSTLKALPVQYLLNKVSLMPKSSDVETMFESWTKTYKRLSDDDTTRIKEMIARAEGLAYSRKFKKANKLLPEIDTDIQKFEAEYENILNDLTNATQVDVKNREEITNQKEIYRNYKKMYQSNSNVYKPFNNAIEKYFEQIETSFTNIDILLNQSQVDKAKNKCATLDGDLLKMKDILNNLPDLVQSLTKTIPQNLTEIEDKYNYCVTKKYNVGHLNIVQRFRVVHEIIVESLSKNNDIFIKDLTDNVDFLTNEIKEIFDELAYEEKANEHLKMSIERLVNISVEIENISRTANNEVLTIVDKYVLSDNELANLKMETQLVDESRIDKNRIVSEFEHNAKAASLIEKDVDNLIPRYNALKIAFDAYIRRIEDVRADELRLRDEYYNMTYLIRECESRLKMMKLPMLSNSYNETIFECKSKLDNIESLLNEMPLNISLISSNVRSACDVVYKLYDNSRNLLKTAQMTENALVFANRFRSRKPEINTMLTRSEALFNNGEYTKALSTALEAIETLYPGVRKELLKYKTSQLQKTPILK